MGKKKSNKSKIIGIGLIIVLALVGMIYLSSIQSSFSFVGGDINATSSGEAGFFYSHDFEDGADYYISPPNCYAPSGWNIHVTEYPNTYCGARDGDAYGISPIDNYLYVMFMFSGMGTTGWIEKDFTENIDGASIDFEFASEVTSPADGTYKIQFFGLDSLISEVSLPLSQVTWTHHSYIIPDGTDNIRFWQSNPSGSRGSQMYLDNIVIGNPLYQLDISDGFTTQSTEFTEGDEVTLSAIPRDDYVFNNWSGDIESDEQNISFIMSSDMSLVANFEVDEIIVYVSSGTKKVYYHEFPEEEVEEIVIEEEIIEPEISKISELSTGIKGFFTNIWDKFLGIFKW